MIDVEQIVRQYIDKTVHMSLATVKDDKPWVCEVHFAYDDELNLYFVSKQDTRHCHELESNPHVAGNIIKQHDLSESPNGIYFEGIATVLSKPSVSDIQRYCSRLKRDPAELIERLNQDSQYRMYTVRINNWAAFGKFDGESNQKYTLTWNKSGV